MTREEAIKIVQSATVWTDEEREALAMLIPELAESEDERIRKWIKKEIEDKYVVEGIVNNKLADEAFGWLEKQKHLYETTKDRFYREGFEEGQLYEKQKENPKSADSIPSDCVSDAKCGDRWHKVEDSLPDNTREVLCKDTIGNYFIGRYYSKGVWEVSMYDDCDKSNEDNPPVVMWIDIPSEKQKEQKPLLPEDKVKHPLYMEGFEAGKEVGRQYEKVFGKQKEQKPMNNEKEFADEWDGHTPQEAAERIYNYLQLEQPEVELNEETIINEFRVIRDKCFNEGIEGWQREKLIARHFYELGLKSLK